MTGVHPDIGAELRKLAQTIVDGIDPAVRAAAARASGLGPGRCQQVWCPVCALAALVSGEQHPLLSVVADHSVALLGVIRAIVDDMDRRAPPPPPPDGAPADDTSATNRYQPIPVTVEE